MASGFFPKSTLVGSAPASLAPKCGACGLFKTCLSPKMTASGNGRRKILLVGEAPGRNEDEQNIQFVGQAGERLRKTLASLGVDMREDCWITNALICRPPGNKIPKPVFIDYCRPNLTRTMAELNPNVVILLGGTAVRSLIGDIWKENPGALSRWAGWNIPSQRPNAWVCPTYHPSYLEREKNPVLDEYFRTHLEAAVSYESKPWATVPDWDKRVEAILSTDDAAALLRQIEQEGGEIAFDYENTALKPETPGAEAICASVSNGRRTFAYPWHGEAIKATGELLRSDRCGFIASNMKHEDRWTRYIFGHRVRHWIWDTMVAAHVLDNRTGITGLKFQSFVHLGMPSYNDHIEQFLHEVKGKRTNLAKEEVDLRQLLHYCAVDSLLEFKLAKVQMRNMSALQNPYWFIPKEA